VGDPQQPLHVLDLCSGIGGFSLGVRLAVPHARTVGYVEREAFAVAVLVAQMEAGRLDPAPVWTDLASFLGRGWRGRVDLITAGIPCQPWSLAGKRRGFDDRRHLGQQLVRVVRQVEPGLVFVENVPGFVSVGLPRLLGELADLGFDARWDLFSAAADGAPHIRQRLYMLATHPDRAGLEGRQDPDARLAALRSRLPSRWPSQPDVGRAVNVVPNRVDRIRALGNAVVPQVVARALTTLLNSP
jgi:site-specific DNA-cytosine methylase